VIRKGKSDSAKGDSGDFEPADEATLVLLERIDVLTSAVGLVTEVEWTESKTDERAAERLELLVAVDRALGVGARNSSSRVQVVMGGVCGTSPVLRRGINGRGLDVSPVLLAHGAVLRIVTAVGDCASSEGGWVDISASCSPRPVVDADKDGAREGAPTKGVGMGAGVMGVVSRRAVVGRGGKGGKP
jgi:hypothetical protein